MTNDHPARKLALKFMAELRQKDDEIERLQSTIKFAEKVMAAKDVEIERLHSEIAQLHAALGNQWKAHKDDWEERGASSEMRAEIEQLKVTLSQHIIEVDKLRRERAQHVDEIKRLKAEVDELKADMREGLRKW